MSCLPTVMSSQFIWLLTATQQLVLLSVWLCEVKLFIVVVFLTPVGWLAKLVDVDFVILGGSLREDKVGVSMLVLGSFPSMFIKKKAGVLLLVWL